MLKIIGLVACVLQVTVLVYGESKGFYSVIGPGTIRDNSDYHVSVSMHDSTEPSSLEIGIVGPKFNDTKTVEVKPFSTEFVKFKVPELGEGDYNLTVISLSGMSIKNTTKLNVEHKFYSVYIQTDKATYKPGDLVRFRVLVLDANTRPLNDLQKDVDIIINDSALNRIKQMKKIKLTKGVYNGEIQLSTFPVLGNWKIDVSVGGEIVDKSFEVAKYVLPKFDVQIESPKDITIKDSKVHATIRSKYTYGKPVKGTVRVTIEPQNRIWNLAKQPFAEKTIAIDGKAKIEFDLATELNIRSGDDYYYPPLLITAFVKEELTDLTRNSTATVTLHRDRFKIEGLPTNPSVYHPGKSFQVAVAVKLYDGTPVEDSKNPVNLYIETPRYHYFADPASETVEIAKIPEQSAKLQSNGIATFDVSIPSTSNSTYYTLKATYFGQNGYLGSVTKFEPKSGNYFSVDVETEKPALNKDVKIKVSSNKEIPYFFYQVIGRGNILHAAKVDVPEKETTQSFTFKPTFEMIPKAQVFVYLVQDGDLIFEETTVNFENELENFVNIEVPEQAKPGEDVKIKVSTNPDSYVGLLGVDQSVLLLKSGNDLSKDTVLSDLGNFNTRTPWMRGWGRYPGQQAGLVTMTNANYAYDENNAVYFSGAPISLLESAVGVAGFGGRETPLVVRKEFPETWIWENESRGNGEFTLQNKVPDTITSWVLTGFSVNPKTGLGLTNLAQKLTVFQPFFVSTNLPYSVKRGEVIAIPVIVFNYLNKDLDAEVVMDNTDKEFDFTEATNEIDEKTIDEIKRSKRLSVPANSGKSVSFMIRPKKVGHISIKITATTPIAGDAVQKSLLVEPEGVTEYVNKPIFFNLVEEHDKTEEIAIDVPEKAVPDSTHIEVSVVGDILGPTIKNLDKLVRMPYGCGEQNMVNFVPNILVLKYLTNIGQLTPTIEEKAKKYLEVGYQKELTYKHDDGSYSAFGKSDGNGSTWLTAYVCKSFHEAAPYTDIDMAVIDQGLQFLADQQTSEGRFPENGKVIDKAHSGDSDNGIALTAFVLLSFLENAEVRAKYEANINNAVKYLNENLDKTDDTYALAISAYALQLAKSEKSEKLIAQLNTVAKNENGLKWWSKPVKENKEKDYFWYRPRSADVEMTAYALLAFLKSSSSAETLPILKWLITQRNSNGGFASTQDTVVGLQSLIKFSEKFSSGKAGVIDVGFTDDAGTNEKIKVNNENSLLLQTHILPNTAKKVSLNAKGEGSCLVQVSYKYNIATKSDKPRFLIKPVVKKAGSSDQLKLDVCVSYVPIDDDIQSNMAVVEVNLPSGFTATDSEESLDALKNTRNVKRIETKNKESTIVIYFDNLDMNEICAPVEATKTSAVAKQKPVAIEAYDYYNNVNRGIEYYEIKSSLCDICADEDCGAGCVKSENP